MHLRQMFNFLQVEECLFVTADEYSIVKLTEKGAAFLEAPEPIEMKMAKEREKQVAGSSKKSRRGAKLPAGAAEFTEKEETLFEALRALRREIASEEKVPPYIVFSDKTLTHMCILNRSRKQRCWRCPAWVRINLKNMENGFWSACGSS